MSTIHCIDDYYALPRCLLSIALMSTMQCIDCIDDYMHCYMPPMQCIFVYYALHRFYYALHRCLLLETVYGTLHKLYTLVYLLNMGCDISVGRGNRPQINKRGV